MGQKWETIKDMAKITGEHALDKVVNAAMSAESGSHDLRRLELLQKMQTDNRLELNKHMIKIRKAESEFEKQALLKEWDGRLTNEWKFIQNGLKEFYVQPGEPEAAPTTPDEDTYKEPPLLDKLRERWNQRTAVKEQPAIQS